MRTLLLAAACSAVLWNPVALAATPATSSGALDDVLAPLKKDRLFRDAGVAVQVVDIRSGEEMWAYEADTALNPASTMKVVTAATALKVLGPSHTFVTTVHGGEAPDGAGVVKGGLYVRGTGDPTLVIEKLWRLARDLELAGVTKVQGDLVLDESLFGPDHGLVGWDKKADVEHGPSYFPALSALSLNFNTAAVVVRPASEAGKPAIVTVDTPSGGYLTVESTVTTGRPGTRPTIGIERVVSDGAMSFVVEGSVPTDDRPRRYHRSVGDPTAFLGGAFRDVLAERGITITGTVRTGTVPASAEWLAQVESPPLTSILADMNKYSSNFMAEQVLRAVGAQSRGEGTTAAGVLAVQDYLDSLGLPRSSYTLVNGSGLSREAGVAPSVLTAVLVDMARDPRVGHEFASSLAIAGRDGTLRRRLVDEVDRLRGKTGTLDGVHCLTGYLEGDDGAMYAFAFLVNDFAGGSSRVKSLHDDFAQRLFQVSADATADDSKAPAP